MGERTEHFPSLSGAESQLDDRLELEYSCTKRSLHSQHPEIAVKMQQVDKKHYNTPARNNTSVTTVAYRK